jgi:hypothetical protein
MEAMRIKQVSECTAFKRYFSIAIVLVVYFVMTVSLRDSSWHVKSKARTRKYRVRQEASRSMTSCGKACISFSAIRTSLLLAHSAILARLDACRLVQGVIVLKLE